MIRILIGSAFPILSLCAAAVYGPDLLTGPRGEPMVVMAPANASIQQASYDGATCAKALVFNEEDLLFAPLPKGKHVVQLAYRDGDDGGSLVVANPDEQAVVVLVFDDQGRILSVAPAPSVRERMLADAYAADCLASDGRPAGI